jgi:murein DD-endopeptidase MepM/ murein hydrolase activator NlpD
VTRRAAQLLGALLLALFLVSPAAAGLRVTWRPAKARVGDVSWVYVTGAGDGATLEGSVAGRSLTFFPYGTGWAALTGFDLDLHAAMYPWQIAVLEEGGAAKTVRGRLQVGRRAFRVERLTLPSKVVDLDPETERRVADETERLRALYRTVTPDRLWRGRFTEPVATTKKAGGFGARRVINGQPRAPHSGADYRAPLGTPVVAVNGGRVAVVADYFFPGKLVVIDHGLGLYTAYFHLDTVTVPVDAAVDRGQPIGTVGETGRATGPHLHFAVVLGGSRVDPAALLRLPLRD